MTKTHSAGRPSLPGCRSTAALLGLLLCAAPSAGTTAGGPFVTPPAGLRSVCIRGICFESEIAVTADERARGLMDRDALAANRGMLFVFPAAGRHGFWMKNTRIELDIIFIAPDHKVVGIARRAQPCRKDPCERHLPEGDAAYVLEIAGGLAATYGFSAGDPVEFREPAAGR